jgi:N-acyl-L-homoserine lactone synthetase
MKRSRIRVNCVARVGGGEKTMRFMVCETPAQIHQAQELRYEVYCEEKGWVEPSAAGERTECDAHDSGAVHFLALTAEGDAVGTARYLLGHRQELPAGRYLDFEQLGLEAHEVTEVSRLAIRRGNRSQDLAIFLGLTRLMWHWGMEHSVRSWCAVADVPLYKLLARLRIPTLVVGEPVDYLGSKCIPVAFDMPGSGAALYRRLHEAPDPMLLHAELSAASGLIQP